MLVQIRDREALSSLSLLSLRSYLNSRGWIDDGPWGGGRAVRYVKEHAGQTWDILVPVRDTAVGYAEGMAQAVKVLSEVEERSQLDVFYDLKATGADVIRVRSANGLAHANRLSLRQSAGNAQRYLQDGGGRGSGPRRRPRAIYRGKLSADVAEYLDSVRPLPGYTQGYAVTLHSPGAR